MDDDIVMEGQFEDEHPAQAALAGQEAQPGEGDQGQNAPALPEAEEEGNGEPQPKRQRTQYTDAQKELVRKCVLEHNMGYKKILLKYPDWGFNPSGLRTMVENIKARKTTERKQGSGRPKARRTAEMVDAARQYMDANADATCGDLVKETGLRRTTAQRVLKEDLELKPLRKVTAQRVKESNKEKRLQMCKKWEEDIASGALDLTKVYWTDEKVFRLGACSGGNQNLVVWVKNTLKKAELPNDLILREDGKFQGGASVMVSLGLSYRGAGTLRFAPAGTKINAATYLEIIENTYLPDCHQLYGVPPDCVFQQDGATSHTANRVQAFCKERFPNFWDKNHWPANSPDLNPLDFFAWGYLQSQVDKKNPLCLDTLKVAIRQAVAEMPLEMVQKAVLGFEKRVGMCIEAEGGVFKHKKLVGHPIANAGAGEEEEGAEGESNGEE